MSLTRMFCLMMFLLCSWSTQKVFSIEPSATTTTCETPIHFCQEQAALQFGKPYKIRAWSEREMMEVRENLEELKREQPGLFLLIGAAESELRIFRVTELTTKVGSSDEYSAIARVFEGSLFITNSYFETQLDSQDLEAIREFNIGSSSCLATEAFSNKNLRKLILLHELVHAADPGSRIAYQPVFIDFINRCKNSLSVLPSKFAFLNLNESLACFYADGSNGLVYSLPKATTHQLQKPTSIDLDWNKHYRTGCRLRKMNRVQAISELRTSFSIDNQCPMPLFMIGRCYYDQKDYPKSIESLQAAEEIFINLGVPDSEPTRILSKYLIARGYAEQHNWNQAKPLLNCLTVQSQNIDVQNAAKEWLKYCIDMQEYEHCSR